MAKVRFWYKSPSYTYGIYVVYLLYPSFYEISVLSCSETKWHVPSRLLVSPLEERLHVSNWPPRQLVRVHLPPVVWRNLTDTGPVQSPSERSGDTRNPLSCSSASCHSSDWCVKLHRTSRQISDSRVLPLVLCRYVMSPVFARPVVIWAHIITKTSFWKKYHSIIYNLYTPKEIFQFFVIQRSRFVNKQNLYLFLLICRPRVVILIYFSKLYFDSWVRYGWASVRHSCLVSSSFVNWTFYDIKKTQDLPLLSLQV